MLDTGARRGRANLADTADGAATDECLPGRGAFTGPTPHPDGRWKPITADGIELFNLEAVPITRYRYRGNTIPNPWTLHNHAMTAGTVESPVR